MQNNYIKRQQTERAKNVLTALFLFLTSASDGLLEEILKSKPMIFQAPLLFKMMFSGHKLP